MKREECDGNPRSALIPLAAVLGVVRAGASGLQLAVQLQTGGGMRSLIHSVPTPRH